jgi:hypothetical protein
MRLHIVVVAISLVEHVKIRGHIIGRDNCREISQLILYRSVGRPSKSKMSLQQVLDEIAKSILPKGQLYMLKDVIGVCFQSCEIHGKMERIKAQTPKPRKGIQGLGTVERGQVELPEES